MDVHADLRRWACGLYPLEAGVELLIRAFDGRFAGAGWPWIVEARNRWYVDGEVLAQECGALSGGEQRVLRFAAGLLDGPPVDLTSLSGIDHERQDLILAALRHSGGRRVWPVA